jgi:cobalt-zinc-cadmium efflux system membrane fusion protein
MKCSFSGALLLAWLLPVWAVAQPLLHLGPAELAALEVEVYQTGRVEQQLSDPVMATVTLSDQHQLMLSLPVTGTVRQLRVLPGARVSVGTELGTIVSREALELQREYLAARDQQERNRASRQRDESLYKGGAIPAKRWQQTLAEWRQGEALLTELSSQLSALGFNADDLERLETRRELRSELVLRSPIDGVVLQCATSPGEAFDAGLALFHIGDPGHLWLELMVSQSLARQASPGDKVYLDSQAIAVVLQVGAAIEPASQSVLLTAELDTDGVGRSDPGLMPGQSLLVRLALQARSGFWVPRDSIVNIGGASTVFVRQDKGFQPREVKLVPALNGWVALSGLVEGEAVVHRGSAALKGMLMGLGEVGDNAE